MSDAAGLGVKEFGLQWAEKEREFVKTIHWVLALLMCAASTSALSQEVSRPWEEYSKLIHSRETVSALGPTLFGDSLNLANGALSFSATDISIPGNSRLAVALSRTYTAGNRKGMSVMSNAGTNDLPFADWDLDLPSLSGVFASTWDDTRCSASPRPPSKSISGTYFYPEDYWQGNHAGMPGGGEMLQVNAATTKPSTGGPYYWVTTGFTYFSCLPTIKNGTGEGFLAITADGTKYWFDWMAQYYETPLKGPKSTSGSVTRRKNELYATRVEDRFGNWVAYTYSNGWNGPVRLSQIDASDGRQITVGYNPRGYVSTVSNGTQTWNYQYSYPTSATGTLSAVVLPDNSRWTIDFSGLSSAVIRYDEGQPGANDPVRSCASPGDVITPGATGTITHPSGAVGEFSVEPIRHGRSNVPMVCSGYTSPHNNDNDDYAYYPLVYDALTLTKKRVTGPGVAATEWNYSYYSSISWAAGTGPVCTSGNCWAAVCTSDSCAGTDTTEVSGPAGAWNRYTFGNSYRYNEGKLLRVETGTGPSAILKTETSTYLLPVAGSQFAAPIGTSPQMRGDGFTSAYLRPQLSNAITQDGATFNWQVSQCGDIRCYDNYARPTSVYKSSSLGYAKTDATEYYNDLSRWVIGQVSRQYNADTGIVTSQTDYWPSTALPQRTWLFGKAQQYFVYNADGTLATVTDGRSYTTTLSNWKRGIPQLVQYPDAVSQSAIVNDLGWITSVTDENGFATGYGYDAMGRVSGIAYPAGDAVAWTPKSVEFRALTNADWKPPGVSTGQWRQYVGQGNYAKLTYFDAMWRPVLVHEYDVGNVSGTLRSTSTSYDQTGKVAFQSYPSSDLIPAASGIWSFYDALGRSTSVKQDSELGQLTASTEYLPGFQVRVTNPRGQQTLTTMFQAYDQPAYDWPRGINEPEGKFTEIYRDLFGKPTAVRRRNGDGSQSAWRYYVYRPDWQTLCKTIEPETGATVMDNDAAGNLGWSASGLSLPDTGNCNLNEGWGSGRRVDRSYDARNRLSALSFAGGRGNQIWSYTPDGLPAQITTYNDAGSGAAVVNGYAYNKRRLMTGENVSQPGWYTWGIGYGYDTNANLAAQSYPTGLYIDYAPNALGQPTKAGAWATGVSYYPNGGIRQFTYGNGIVHTMTQNARQLPTRVTDAGALDYTYAFDANANPVTIRDVNAVAGAYSGNRDLQYDGLDRLTYAHLHWQQIDNFSYDALDNMRRKDHYNGSTTTVQNYYYDSSNRLTNIQDGAGASIVGLGYDAQGNLANKNGQAYEFDIGNRLRGATNQEWYRYDGQGRRVLNWRWSESGVLSQYSQAGQLVYDENYRASGRKASEYIYLQGSLLATRERNIDNNAYATKYQHTDVMGSPVAVTNEAGQVIERTNYEPFGAAINKPSYDGIGYTGHVMDAATGLTYMQQRYYDPTLGRFLSVDPVTADGNTGGNFNRYKYANNNPYRFVDPDGRKEKEFEEIEKKDTRSLGAHSSNLGGMATSAHSFSAQTAQQRFNSANKALGKVKETMEGKSHTSAAGAATTFHNTAQPISSKYGVEVESLIDKQLSGAYFLTGTTIGTDFRDDGIGYTVGSPTDGLPTIHSHPISGGARGSYYPFSDSDVNWYGSSRSRTHFVSTPDGTYEFNGIRKPVTEISP